MKKCVVVTGGGTGGHLKIADVFIEEFKKRDIEVIFIGSSNGQDKAWFEDDKRLKKAVFLDTYGVVNKKFIGKITSLLNIFKKVITCLKIFSKYKVKSVISVGGFSAAPASFASILNPKCDLYIHEQNSVMGKLNQITSKFAKEIFSSYTENSKVKDYPVSQVFFDKARLREEVKTIAFFGGSQGAIAINDFALKLASKLDEKGYKILHQTGKKDYQRVKKEYENLGINADVFDFSKDIPSKMNEADFAISRAGASTLWETVANALPTFFIPYPYAAANHQYFNAKVLLDKNLCFLQKEDELDEEYFFKCLDSDIKTMSENLKNNIKSNAIEKIANEILK